MKKGDDKELLDVLLDSVSSRELLRILLKKLQLEQNLQLDQVIQSYVDAKGEIILPLSIFAGSLQPAEALTKYLKEHEELSYKQIALLLNRDERSVWASYKRAAQKRKSPFVITHEDYYLPISILQDRSYSLLESVIYYLYRVHKLKTKEIAALLHKSAASIAVLLKRAREKHRDFTQQERGRMLSHVG